MLIAIPISENDAVSTTLKGSTAIRFYKDDHGRIIQSFTEPVDKDNSAFRIIERRGVDAVVCEALTAEEAQRFAESGLLVSAGASGPAEAAALAYLGKTVSHDPQNACRVCA